MDDLQQQEIIRRMAEVSQESAKNDPPKQPMFVNQVANTSKELTRGSGYYYPLPEDSISATKATKDKPTVTTGSVFYHEHLQL